MPQKIINGTLFYVIEYFLVLNEIEPTLLILKCDKKIFDYIITIIKIKYKYNKLLDNLIKNTKYTELPKLIQNSVLILDTNTYYKCKPLIKQKIFLYSQNGKNSLVENTYGFYNYQVFKHKVRLKLALSYHKEYNEIYNTFNSSPKMNITKDSKNPNKFQNIMEYKHWHYIHNGFDTNNRFIPEARYFNKQLSHTKIIFNDSINDRLITPIENLILTKYDRLIKDFINE